MQSLRLSRNQEYLAILCVIVSVFLFFSLTIRDGHEWGDDFALYIKHAKNLAEGHPYSDTGYLINPLNPWVSPAAYPPVFPAILAPVVKVFGFDLQAFKITLIFLFAVTLLIFHQILLSKTEYPITRILSVAFAGVSPWFWDFKDQVLSEIPFIMFMMLFLLICEKWWNVHDPSNRTKIVYGISIAIIAYLAYGCRSVGLLLVPTFALATLLYYRRIDRVVIIALVGFGLLYYLQNLYLDVDSSYKKIVSSQKFNTGNAFSVDDTLISRLFFNAKFYLIVLSRYWDNEFSMLLRIFLYALTSFLSLYAAIILLKKKNVSILFAVGYAAFLLAIPFLQGNRYVLPILPFYIFLIFFGLEKTVLFLDKTYRIPAYIAFVILITVSYAGSYTYYNFKEYDHGVNDPVTQEMFAYIQKNTDKDSIIVFIKPRALALLTGRNSFAYSIKADEDVMWKNINEMGADFLLNVQSGRLSDRDNYLAMIRKYGKNLDTVFSNREYRLYRVMPQK